MKFKFEIGEKVLVNKVGYERIDYIEELWNYVWISELNKWIGKIVTISQRYNDTHEPTYEIKEDKYGWQESWFSKSKYILPDNLFEI